MDGLPTHELARPIHVEGQTAVIDAFKRKPGFARGPVVSAITVIAIREWKQR
jgi:hypothetical protein